jgi:hypothetical protein
MVPTVVGPDSVRGGTGCKQDHLCNSMATTCSVTGMVCLCCVQVVPAKSNLLGKLQEDVVGKDEVQLTRLLGETEDAARRREEVRKRLEMMEKAAREISMFG